MVGNAKQPQQNPPRPAIDTITALALQIGKPFITPPPQTGRTSCKREGVSDGTVANAQPAARVTPGQFDRSMRWIPNPLGSRNRLRFLILSLKKPGKASDSHLCPRGIMTIVKNNLDSLPFLFLTIATTFPNFWTFQDGIAGETFRSPAKS